MYSTAVAKIDKMDACEGLTYRLLSQLTRKCADSRGLGPDEELVNV